MADLQPCPRNLVLFSARACNLPRFGRRIVLATIWVLVLTLVFQVASTHAVTYRLVVDNTWSELTHPGLFPVDAHFSWIAGATHTSQTSFWNEGQLATPGIQRMAEIGETSNLYNYMGSNPGLNLEVNAAITAGDADQFLEWRHWFCPVGTSHASCGTKTVEFDVDENFPLVTLVTMLGPSPDWFVGISGMSLRQNGQWIPKIVVDLRPYDGGTRDANTFNLFGPLTNPQEPVSLITAASGQIITPASLGTMTFQLIAPLAADFDADMDVDSADLGIWQSAFGVNANGDTDADGDSDGADFLSWQREFTGPLGPLAESAAAVPEPGGLAISVLAMQLLIYRRRR